MKNSVIIVAGGSGQRMGTEIPKQFLLLNGKPIILHCIQHFLDFDPDIKIIIVLPESHITLWKTICSDFSFHVEHSIAMGGETRYQSVKNGLELVNNCDFIAIHDSVRPNINSKFVENCFSQAVKNGNAIPAISLNESLRELTGTENKPLNRENVRIIQTPQVFSFTLLKEAYLLPYENKFTDDATVFESYRQKIHLIPGLQENIKITLPSDLLYLEWRLKNSLQRNEQ